MEPNENQNSMKSLKTSKVRQSYFIIGSVAAILLIVVLIVLS